MADSTGFFVWYELMTSDVAAAKDFYGRVLGWRAEDVPMPGMTYTLVKVDRKSTRLNSSHSTLSRMPSSA